MIHLNLGSNLGDRFNNITIAVNLLIEAKIKVIKISNFYETPSYPNQNLPKYLNVGIFANYANDHFNLFSVDALAFSVLQVNCAKNVKP